MKVRSGSERSGWPGPKLRSRLWEIPLTQKVLAASHVVFDADAVSARRPKGFSREATLYNVAGVARDAD
ncbi:MAG: hypothetical protein DWQ08_09190 [Proteobacteria bacterium]|nr:MAG: hypothetical protein DWQ08_09190 [Pseudomonadota bacterium]